MIYRGAGQPGWSPSTEDDLAQACRDGLLAETHHLEVKRQLDRGAGANKELAKDLASMAIDGGTFIVGVAEDKATGQMSLAPQPLAGVAERVEQIGWMSIDPGLAILVDTIPSAANETTGYLLVHVPSSPQAPHMVDGRYYGRGDKTKRTLSDAEVTRLHALRSRSDEDTIALLRQEIDRDPAGSERKNAHLYLVAEPVAARRELLLATLDGRDVHDRLYALLNQAWLTPLPGVRPIAPDWKNCSACYRRAGRTAMSSYGLNQGRQLTHEPHDPESALDIEFLDGGGLRLWLGRLSYAPQDQSLVLPDAALMNTRLFLALALAVADSTGHLGTWSFGFAATGLRGLPVATDHGFMDTNTYDTDEEIRVTGASYEELATRPGSVADRLVGHMARTYRLRERHLAVLSDDPSSPTQ